MQFTLPEYGVIRPLEVKRHLEPRIVVPLSFAMKARSVTIYAKDIELQLLIILCTFLWCSFHYWDETIKYDY